jgi:hypothetical protein
VLSAGGTRLFETNIPQPHEARSDTSGINRSIRWVLRKGIRPGLRFWLAVETGDTGRDAIFTQNLLAVATK